MPSDPTPREAFEEFLAGVPVDTYRERYRPNKTVELDLPKDIQVLRSFYQCYWDEGGQTGDFLDYETFYDQKYLPPLRNKLEDFRQRNMFSKGTWRDGLRARIYRTWASLLTQAQGAYIAGEIYGMGNVRMSVSQDRRGRDIVFHIPGIGDFGVQIKKISERKDAKAKRGDGGQGLIEVYYAVPRSPPLTPVNKQPAKPYQRWEEEWGHLLQRLDNGFVIFKREMFEAGNLLRALND